MASAVMIGLAVAGAAVQYSAARQQSKAAQAAADYNAVVADQNAQVAIEQSQMEAEQIGRENRLRLSATRAAAGASGIATEGSVIDVIGDLTTQGELDRQMALYEGELRARGYKVDRDLSRAESANARTSGRLSGASALITGASNVYSAGSALRVGG